MAPSLSPGQQTGLPRAGQGHTPREGAGKALSTRSHTPTRQGGRAGPLMLPQSLWSCLAMRTSGVPQLPWTTLYHCDIVLTKCHQRCVNMLQPST